MTLLSYRGHPAVTKAAFVAEMEAHLAADRIKAGFYWNGGSGCAIGCGIQSILTLHGPNIEEHSDHAAHAAALGIPAWLSEVQDTLFENLSRPDQQLFPVAFARALPDGVDLSGLYAAWMPWVLREVVLPAAGRYSEVCAVIERVAAGLESNWATDDLIAVRLAAGAAVQATTQAVAFAAGEVVAMNAAWAAANCAAAAGDAAGVGGAARNATRDSVRSAIRAAAWNAAGCSPAGAGVASFKMANRLLVLMAACPEVAS